MPVKLIHLLYIIATIRVSVLLYNLLRSSLILRSYSLDVIFFMELHIFLLEYCQIFFVSFRWRLCLISIYLIQYWSHKNFKHFLYKNGPNISKAFIYCTYYFSLHLFMPNLSVINVHTFCDNYIKIVLYTNQDLN